MGFGEARTRPPIVVTHKPPTKHRVPNIQWQRNFSGTDSGIHTSFNIPVGPVF